MLVNTSTSKQSGIPLNFLCLYFLPVLCERGLFCLYTFIYLRVYKSISDNDYSANYTVHVKISLNLKDLSVVSDDFDNYVH